VPALRSILAFLFSGMKRVSTFSPLFMKIGEFLVFATRASFSSTSSVDTASSSTDGLALTFDV
jgi:hypothetical protein